MPLVRVDIIKGKTEEYKAKLLNCIHEGLVESIGTAREDLCLGCITGDYPTIIPPELYDEEK